jgi:predicted ATPase with chaperone activity
MNQPMIDESLADLIKQPQTIDELGIPQSIVSDILLRLLYNEGNVSFPRMVQVLKVPMMLNTLLDLMRQEHQIEVQQAYTTLGPLNYIYKLTDEGFERAHKALERSNYVGPIPVSVAQYTKAIEMQSHQTREIDPRELQEVLSDLYLPKDFHRALGSAVNSASSLFLYGPSGNGKTTIAKHISKLIAGTDPIWLPYAITAGGQIIQIHDRLFHNQVEIVPGKFTDRLDARWALYQRPAVLVGGELKMDALDLRYDPVARIYEAPLQLKANGGIFIIDDFGRQQVSPVDLLNRWIVPLENGIDYLRLGTGQMIVVPFKVFIVFSTNLHPYELADDAFYRRIQMKIGVFSPDEDLYRQIFLQVCGEFGVTFDEKAYQHLLEKWYHMNNRPFQAVHPRDIVKIVRSLCLYEKVPTVLTSELIDEACSSYFVEEK